MKQDKNISNEDKCLRCGKCCVIHEWEGWTWCKYLHVPTEPNEKFSCTIYKNRIGKNLGSGFKCGYRKDLPWDIPECPYNTGKPIHPAYK